MAKRDFDIWAACGLSKDSFAVSVGRMEDDPQFSRLCFFSAGPPERWDYLPLESTIVSLAPRPGRFPQPAIAALGIDGDVRFVAGDRVEREDIPQAGSGDDDEIGLGSMSRIICTDGYFAACGYGSQVYRRDASGDWRRLAGDQFEDMGENSFEDVAVNAAGRVAACGFADARYRAPTAEEEQELDRIADTGTMQQYLEARERFTALETGPRGCLFIFDGKSWTEVEVPGNGYLYGVARLPDDRFVAVGGGGLVLAGKEPDLFEDLSDPGFTETFHAVRALPRKSYLLADTCILVLDSHLRTVRSVPLPEPFASPLSIDVIDDTLWYFDHEGVARLDGDRWHVIQVPDPAWQPGP